MVSVLLLLHMMYGERRPFFIRHIEMEGGAMIGFAPWVYKFVIYKGEDPSHSCVWALTFINDQPIGFCLVYAANSAKES